MPSKRQKQAVREMVHNHSVWAVWLTQFPRTSFHLSVSASPHVLTLIKGHIPPRMSTELSYHMSHRNHQDAQ